MVFVGVLISILITLQGSNLVACTSKFYDDDLQSSNSIAKTWGISDTTTCVGKLFHYNIPPEQDAFKGPIHHYEVEGEESGNLPKWLMYDKGRSILEGVPSIEGDFRIIVKAYDDAGKFVSDIFVIEVYPLEERNTNDKRKCERGEIIMMLDLIINRKLDDIQASERISAIRSLSRYFNIPSSTILLLPQSLTVDSVFSSTLRYDRNDTDEIANFSVMTWQIGCNEKIWAEQVKVVELVEKSVNDESLSDVINLPITRLNLVSNLTPFRNRRHATNSTHVNNSVDNADDDGEEDGDDVLDDADDVDDENVDENLASPLSRIAFRNTSSPNQNADDGDEAKMLENWDTPKAEQASKTDFNSDSEVEENTDQPIDKNFDDSFMNGTISVTPNFEANATSDVSAPPSSTVTAQTDVRHSLRVQKILPPYVLEAGKVYRERIPEDIFIDGEGNTNNLTLKLLKNETCSPFSFWIELDPEDQTLLMIPSEEAISQYNFQLFATNSANQSANVSFNVGVQYPKQARQINFEISLHLKLKGNQNLTASVQLYLLELLARLYGDKNTDNFYLQRVSCDPFVFTWTNKTLPLDQCDTATIIKLLKVLTDEEGSTNVNKNVNKVLGALVTVEKVTWQSFRHCEGVVPKAKPLLGSKQNFIPIPSNRVDNVTGRVGELLVFKIPEDSFYDAETPNGELKLTLSTYDNTNIPADNWLQFDEKNKEIYGLPMRKDEGISSYQLVCHDNANSDEAYKARQIIEVIVEPPLRKPYNVEFSMTLNSSFDDFNTSPSFRRTFVEKLATLFGDKDTSSIYVSGYAQGSLTVVWHNKSLPIDRCPESQIEQLRGILQKDNKKLTEKVNNIMEPEFHAISASVSPIGVCEGGLTEIHATEINKSSQEIYATIFNANVPHYIRKYFYDFILPIGLIMLMMILAGIVACILYRKQRRAKWLLSEGDERRSFRNRGIPVIFQDELEERLEPSNKTPIIMKEEKPPLPPPEYPKAMPMATTALLSDFDDPTYASEGGSYSSCSAERNGRGKGTPTYRKPPPYIPP